MRGILILLFALTFSGCIVNKHINDPSIYAIIGRNETINKAGRYYYTLVPVHEFISRLGTGDVPYMVHEGDVFDIGSLVITVDGKTFYSCIDTLIRKKHYYVYDTLVAGNKLIYFCNR